MPKKGETKAPEGGKKAGTKKPPVESKEEIKKEETGKAVELVKEIVVQQPEQVVTTVEELKLDRPKIELLKRTIAKGATDDELLMFINVCKGMGLSPFLKHVHLVKRWDSKIGANVAIVQVGIDGFRSIAEGTGAYAGNDDPKFEGETELEFDTGKQTGKYTAPNQATVIVRKVVQGSPYEFTATARWAEFYPGDKMGFMWRSKPHVMLFLTEAFLVGIGWLPFWLLIATVAVLAFGVASLGTSAVTGG